MDFLEVIEQARAALQRRGRITYRTLKRQFALDDEALEDLKDELLFADPQITEIDGRGLAWNGDRGATEAATETESPSQSPASYTPQHLAERIRAEQKAMESRGSANGERKTITALFADLKGSTALIEGLDPEDARALIDPALQLMMDAVHRYDGYVAQALGDGIFALFGAPIAHEDHPQRALYAALRMQEEMRGYADTLREQGRPPLLMRVGLNTGEVVVRSIRKDDLHADYVPVGHSTNLAARMEQLAAPGSIVVTADTHRLTDGYFEFKDLGKTRIKGVEEPLNVYEVVKAGPLRTRLQVAARRGLTRFVGRQSELDQMHRALNQAKEGHGQIVGVMGEPGLGKSRLFYEFKLTSRSSCLVLEAFSVSHGKASPYLTLIELLKEYFQIEPTDDDRIRKEKVTGRVLTLDRSLEDTLPYLFSLLGVEDEQSSLQQMDALIRRQRTFEALKKLFLRESLNQPLLLIFEDLHWTDSETQGFLDTLSESVASANVLLLVNYRPEYRHDWGRKTYYTQLRLAPLGKAEAEELLAFLLGRDASLAALKALVLEKTEGTPFFMEEVVQTLVEEGALVGDRGHYLLETTPTALHISPTVQGVLAARIDRLAADEKALLQQLSVIGRQFPASLVKRVVQQPEDELYRVLAALQTKEFLYEQPAFPEMEYLFKHALTQEVAYGTVLHEQRKVLHERTGEAIEVCYTENLADHYSQLAYHYSRTNNTQKAVEYLQLAGQQAMQRSANEEAVRHLTRAIKLLQTLPSSSDQALHEVAVQTLLGHAVTAARGYGTLQAEHAFTRAVALSREAGDAPQFFPAQMGLWLTFLVQGKFHTARELGEQLLRHAQQMQDPALLVSAHWALGESLLMLGEVGPAKRLLEHGLRCYTPQQQQTLARLCGQDSGLACGSFASWALWLLGYPDQARRRSDEVLRLAEAGEHLFSLWFTRLFAAVLHHYRREAEEVQEQVTAVIALAIQYGFPMPSGLAFQGWVLLTQGQVEEGIHVIRQNLDAYRATGAAIEQTHWLALLAEGYGQRGETEQGRTLLVEALGLVRDTGEHLWEAELYRMKGTLTLQSNLQSLEEGVKEAETCFQRALDVARQQEAKSWELRAATSLARLWQNQGKTTEARDLLAPVYEWFTEGFDTADLKDAKSLLEELA